jgi:hypothetical protein
MFADLIALRTMLSTEIAPNTLSTMTTKGELEDADPNYANDPAGNNWNDDSYATSCKDYDANTCHYGPYVA